MVLSFPFFRLKQSWHSHRWRRIIAGQCIRDVDFQPVTTCITFWTL